MRQERGLEERIFTGVEADILDSQGTLDLTDEVLAKLDVVIASFHRDEFNDVCGYEIGFEPPYEQVLAAYLNISRNPSVDVIGHPKLPNEPLTEEQWQMWDEIFRNLAQRGACLEINLSPFLNPEKKEVVPQILEFLKRAKAAGVKFMLSLDFHRLEDYLRDTYIHAATFKEITQPQATQAREQLKALSEKAKETVEGDDQIAKFEEEFKTQLAQIFKPGEGAFGVPKYLTTLARPIYHAIRQLQQAGITPQDIVNGEERRFKEWLHERKTRKI